MKNNVKRLKFRFADWLALVHAFAVITVVTAIVLHWLLTKLFALLHIEFYASSHTHLDLERTGGLNPIIIGILSIAGGLLLSVLLILLLMRPSKTDRRLIAGAKPPIWEPISEKDLAAIRELPCKIGRDTLIGCAILLPVLLITGILTQFAAVWLLIAGGVCGIIGITALCMLLHWRMWQRIDKTALCAKIPVYRNENRETRRKGTVTVKHYMICYLPDGKYVLENRSGNLHPQTVHIIRYRGLLRYIPR